MTLAIDASSPTVATSGTSTVTTASFTPPANSLLVLMFCGDAQSTSENPAAPSPTDSLGSHLTYTLRQSKTGSVVGGQSFIWTAPVASSAAMTITAVNQSASGVNTASVLAVQVVTDSNGGIPGYGTGGTGTQATTGALPMSFTATTTNSMGFSLNCDFGGATTTETAGTGTTLIGAALVTGTGTSVAYGAFRRTSPDGVASSTTTINGITSSTQNLWAAIEVVPGIPPSSVASGPVRTGQAREPGPAFWNQRSRSNAHLVATAANPLPSPLDVANGDDATSATAYVTARWPTGALSNAYLQQDRRNALLVAAGPTAADPLQLPDSTWRQRLPADFTDRRLVPQQRVYVSDPTLLRPFLLENELLGGADTPKRYNTPATHMDRREVPQQRVYVSDPALLGTALLENELLGGADTPKRYQLPATHVDRRLVPQQRIYVSDPALLGTALLENELLGGATTGVRVNMPVTHADRRETVPQRLVLVDQSSSAPIVFDPTLGGIPDWLLNEPATHWRAYLQPTQRIYPAYVDDIVMVGSGAAGTWWGEDATAAFIYATMPRPTLPDTGGGAIPFDPTQGGLPAWAGNLADSHWRIAWPQQRPVFADPTLAPMSDPTLMADIARQVALTWAWDRREVPQQRPYISDPSFYPQFPPTDPLALAWGVGGTYWLIYNTAAEFVDRREVPKQRSYVSDPALLGTALLENELLGGAGTAMRYQVPATHADRRVSVTRSTAPDPALLGGFDVPLLVRDSRQGRWDRPRPWVRPVPVLVFQGLAPGTSTVVQVLAVSADGAFEVGFVGGPGGIGSTGGPDGVGFLS